MDAQSPATIGYVNIFVSNFEASLAFYRDRLGLKVATEDAGFGYASFATRGAGFAFARTEDASLIGRHTGIGWIVSDLDGEFDRLQEAGVTFEMPPTRQPWGGYMAMFKDPDGNLFYLDQVEAVT